MTGSHREALALSGFIALAVIAFDQWTKWLLMRSFMLGESQILIPNVLGLSHVRNPGVAFGVMADFAWRVRLPFFILIALVAVWLMVRIYREGGHLVPGRISLGLIVGGAVGNFVDRVRFGAVVDFLDIWIAGYHWPSFNVADSAITCGTVLLLFTFWRLGRR